MSEFLTQSALAERLVEKASLSPEVAKRFSSVFFMIVRKGLKNANTFSVYNFGTFKKTWIETTMGLNPQTGVKIQIPAHWRIKFVPCSAVAKRLNKKYANLKPKLVRVKTNKQKKVSPDGLYAKASKLEMASKDETVSASEKILSASQEDTLSPDNENLGLLAVAENLRAEQAINQVQEEEIPKSENAVEEPTVFEPRTEDEIPEAVNPDEIDNDDYSDEEEELSEKKSRKPVILLLAGAAVLVIVLLISLLVKACSPSKNKKTENEKSAEIKEISVQPEKTESEIEKTEEKTESYYDEIEADELFESYVVPSGGCYNKIAELKYGNRHLWPVLYSANKTLSSDPDYVGLSHSLKIPELPKNPLEKDKKIASCMLEAYNGYLLMCEKEPDSPKNQKRRDLAARVIVSGEIVLPGFIDANSSRILPEYAQKAKSILKNQYKM